MNPETITYLVKRTGSPEQAVELRDFCFPWKDQPAPLTLFRAWHDGSLFYFQFQVEDSDIVLNESATADEKVLGSDRVELFLSPTRDLSQPYYGLEMDPRGLVYDYRGIFHRKFDSSWNCPHLETHGSIENDGYTLQGSIPMATLRDLECLNQDTMITGVFRAEFSHGPDGSIQQDWISWIDPKTPEVDFHIPQTFGTFEFE